MELQELAGKAMMAAWQDEIEHAIDKAKRTALDRWMRTEWHKAGARDRWSRDRKVRWMKWKRRGLRRAVSEGPHRSGRPRVTVSKVWVRGHVPKEFLDWVERYWSHDDETRAVLSGCCFEVWERGEPHRPKQRHKLLAMGFAGMVGCSAHHWLENASRAISP
ncbi:hypothetical protein ACFL09_01620 [Planctomycetota bacterium]